MRTFLILIVLLAFLTGCTGEPDTPGTPVTGSHAAPAPMSSRPGSTMGASKAGSYARLPDRGELLAYDTREPARHLGAYTAYPVDLSEAHALRAITTGTLLVKAPDGELIRLAYERHIEHPDGNWTWIGRNAGGADAVLTFGEHAVFGAIPQGSGDSLRLTMLSGRSWLLATDRRKLASERGLLRRRDQDFLRPPSSATGLRATDANLAAPAAKASTTIDVLLGYTTGFAARLGGQSQAVTRLNNMIDITNQAYANSGVSRRVRLVRTLQVSFPDNTDNGDALEKLTGYRAGSGSITPDPAFNALRAARDQYGADLVSFVRAFRIPENDGCGIAWLVGGDQSGIETGDAPFGYSVVSDGSDFDEGDDNTYFCRDDTLAHEMAHNMGQTHNTEDSDGTGAHAYSYGYREASTSGFFTVMAYPLANGNQFPIRHFANPGISYNGRATGVANVSDNVRSMNQTMPVVATFRADVTPPASSSVDLYGVLRVGTSGTEVHALSAASNFQSFSLHLPTALGRSGTDGSWNFQFGDFNRDGVIDLYCIFKLGSSGRTEAHVLNGATRFSTYLAQVATALPRMGSGQAWVFKLGDYNRDGRLDLYAIAKNGGSGKTEVHVLNGADNFRTYLAQIATALGATGNSDAWKFETGDYNRDGITDLYAILKTGATGKTEVHVLNGVGGFRTFLLHVATALGNTGSDNSWDMRLGDYNGDGTPDLYAILKRGGASGRTELHVLDGAGRFQAFSAHVATGLGSTGSDHAWEIMPVPAN